MFGIERDSEMFSLLLTAISGIFMTIGVFVLWCRATVGQFTSTKSMEGKTVIVTGANSGIGKETAKDLAKRGARVIMACRNVKSANKVRDEIIKETGNEKVFVKGLDLCSFKSVRDFATDIITTESRLDVLINNAGYAETFKSAKSVDDIEMTMATNHYGPFLLTNLLLDLLKKSGPSRIVVVASSLYRLVDADLEIMNPINVLPVLLYYASKSANIMFSNELSKQLEGSNVTVNCLHPGLVDTGIWRNVPFPISILMALLCKMCFKTPLEGAQTTLYLSVSDEVAGVTGKYFSDCKEATLQPFVTNNRNCKILWQNSAKVVKLDL